MFLRNVPLGAALALLLGAVTPLTAQQIAAIRGTVTRSGDNQPVAGVVVTLKGTTIATTTNGNGKYVFLRVPAGSQTLVFRWLGYAPVEPDGSVVVQVPRIVELVPGLHGEYEVVLRDGTRLGSGRTYADKLRALAANPF